MLPKSQVPAFQSEVFNEKDEQKIVSQSGKRVRFINLKKKNQCFSNTYRPVKFKNLSITKFS